MVTDAVKKAGGKLFIAHLYRYNLENPIGFLNILKNNKIIDGVEVEHSIFTEEQSTTLKKYCKENNIGLIVISHDKSLLDKVCHRIVNLEENHKEEIIENII